MSSAHCLDHTTCVSQVAVLKEKVKKNDEVIVRLENKIDVHIAYTNKIMFTGLGFLVTNLLALIFLMIRGSL